MSEVTINELNHLGIGVHLASKEVGRWTKYIDITYEGVDYGVALTWDEQDGYQLDTLASGLPNTVKDLTERPEFEYVLDCITEGDK